MILENDFLFNGIVRWNLGWATPNYAGAFLVTIICLLWAVRGNKYKLFILSIAILFEAVLYYSIARTYSRGSLIALLAGVIFFISSSGLKPITRTWHIWTIRFIILIACIAGTGFFNRIDPNHLTSDASISNRLDLWRGGAEMIASAPWVGWGAGESGRAYMNWFQNIDRLEGYSTMVNSYLNISVEYGLILLTCALTFIFMIWTLAWRSCRTGDTLAGAAGASITAWAAANMFSTLWIEPGLWVIPSIAIILVIWRVWKLQYQKFLWIKLLAASTSVAVMFSIMLYISGIVSAKRYEWVFRPHRGGTIEMISRKGNDKHAPVWHLWADSTIFGFTPGKEVRRWAAEIGECRFYIHQDKNKQITTNDSTGDNIMLCGRQAERIVDPGLLHFKTLWIVHPTFPPPALAVKFDILKNITVIIPEIDETGLNTTWQAWAKQVNASVIVSQGSGLDIRNAWPAIASESRVYNDSI